MNIPLVVAAFIGLDVASGLAQAVMNKELCSTKLRDGLSHKAAFVFAVALAYAVEWGAGAVDLGLEVPIVGPTAAYICLTEIVSCAENLCKLNPELRGSKLMELFKANGED